MEMMRVRPLAGLVAGWLTMFVIGTDLFVVSPLLPMIAADYHVSPAVAGLCVTVFALTYMVTAPLFGHAADRIGRRRVLIWCLVAFAAANLATPHARVEGSVRPVPPDATDNTAAAGGIHSSARDMARWLTALLEAGRTGGGGFRVQVEIPGE